MGYNYKPKGETIMQIETSKGTQSVASAGVGGSALGLGIAGLSVALLNGSLGNIFGGRGVNCNNVNYATTTDLGYSQELARKDSEIALLKSEQNTEIKIADVYDRLITKINANYKEQSDWNAQQMVNNCQMSSAIAVNTNNIASLQNSIAAITKTIVPKDVICPEVMARYNSWTAPTSTASTGD